MGTRRVYAMKLLKGFCGEVVMGANMEHLAVKPKQRAEEPIAQPHGASDDGVEDRPHIIRRAADDAQNLGSRCLPSKRVGQLSLQLLDPAAKVLSSTGC